MKNPILQNLMKNNSNNIYTLISQLKKSNPDVIFNQMMNTNLQFSRFVNSNRGKSIDQIARENNIDLNLLQQFMK